MPSMTNVFIGGFAVSTGLRAIYEGRTGIGVLLVLLGLANYVLGMVVSKCK